MRDYCMIREFALIAALAFSQSPYAALDHSKAPQHDQGRNSSAAPHAAEITEPITQARIASADTNAVESNKPNKHNERTQKAKKDAGKGPVSVPEDEPMLRFRRILGDPAWCAVILTILGTVFAFIVKCYRWRKPKAAAKAIVAIAEAITQEVATEPAYMTVIGIQAERVGNSRICRAKVTWENTGDRPAILRGFSIDRKVVGKNESLPTFDGPLTELRDQELAPKDKIDRSTEPISIQESQRMFGKEPDTLYGLARLEYRDAIERENRAAVTPFTIVARNLLHAHDSPRRDADGNISLFDISLTDWRPPKTGPG
jgi:hypothetical protein